MRIAYLTGTYPRATDTFIQREVAALRDHGLEIHTFSIRPPGDDHMVGIEQQIERDRTTYLLPPNPVLLLIAHLSLLVTAPRRYLRALTLAWSTRQVGLRGTFYQGIYFLEAGILAHHLRQRKIQHLHNHIADSSCTVAMLAADLSGISFSFTMHGPYIFFEPHRWRIDEKIARALFVCCISHYCRSQGMLFAPLQHWAKMHIVHCGVDPDLFSSVSHTSDRQNLLYVGRLTAAKGLPILLESLVALAPFHPQLKLTVIGDGSDRPELERLTAQINLTQQVNFVGYQSQTTVRTYLQNTDVFVLPSFAEGVPVALMEAMAASIPVVTTQIAGISELVEDGVSGFLVPPGDVTTLAARIEHLLKDADERSRLGQAGRLKVQRDFNIHHEAHWLYQIMTHALQGQVESVRPPQPSPPVPSLTPIPPLR